MSLTKLVPVLAVGAVVWWVVRHRKAQAAEGLVVKVRPPPADVPWGDELP